MDEATLANPRRRRKRAARSGARVLRALGKLREAGVLAEALAESDPDNAGAQLLLARIVLNDGRSDEARERYTRAVQLDASLSEPELAAGDTKRARVFPLTRTQPETTTSPTTSRPWQPSGHGSRSTKSAAWTTSRKRSA